MFRIVRCRRCPRCGGWLYVEADSERLDDYYLVCGCCGGETYAGRWVPYSQVLERRLAKRRGCTKLPTSSPERAPSQIFLCTELGTVVPKKTREEIR